MRRFVLAVAVTGLLALPAQAAVVFTNLGTAAPPATLGGFPVYPFDQAPQVALGYFSNVTSIPGSPIGGTIDTSAAVGVRGVPSNGWLTWSHAYFGVVYNISGSAGVTLTLPANTRAFYVYTEPNPFDAYVFTVTTDNGGSSGPISVTGLHGANGFGFHTTAGENITTVTISSSVNFSFGEFGIGTAPGTDDLWIIKTDGVPTASPGNSITYTIVAGNSGPTTATGATVTDTFPAAVLSPTWTCVGSGGASCTAAGSGNISDAAVNIPAGGYVTYTVSGTVDPNAAGSFSNTATITPPTAFNDANSSNNTWTDTDGIQPYTDIQVTKTASTTFGFPGTPVTFTMTVTNAGPTAVTSLPVSEGSDPAFVNVSWTCVATAGSSCGAAAGVGPVSDSVDLLVGGTVTYSVSATIDPQILGGGTAYNSVSAYPAIPDISRGNNEAEVGVAYRTEPVPTLGEVGKGLIILLLAAFGWVALRRLS